jgi:glucosamine--fructose-6-phosphate aminotransferase (isomerizing)
MSRQPAVLRAVRPVNATALRAARELITAARVVRFAALGSSRHAAGYGAVALDVLTGAAAVVLPAVGRAVTPPHARRGDALVVVSQSGRTPALVDVARRARADGAQVVAVVNAPDSPLADLADVVLDCGAGPESSVPATASLTAQMLLLRLLAADVADDELDAFACSVEASLQLVPRLPSTPPRHVVAGGFAAEWVADEVALKLAEMAGVLPSADSLVDHLHGPAAVTTPTLALLGPADPNAEALLAAPHVLTVGGAPGYDLVTPVVGEETLDAIVRVVVGQVLAVCWADELGVDPDAPRGLSKVTSSW